MAVDGLPCTLARKLDHNILFSNVVTGIYHLLVVYGINKYILQFLYQSSRFQFFLEKLGIAPLLSIIERRFAFRNVPPPEEKLDSSCVERDRDLEERLAELELNWRDRMFDQYQSEAVEREEGSCSLRHTVLLGEEVQDLISIENESLEEEFVPGIIDPAHRDFLALLGSDSEQDNALVYDEAMFEPSCVPTGRYFTCLIVLSFQGVLSDENLNRMNERLTKLFGANPRVEKFWDSMALQIKVWTHEYLFDDVETLVKEAYNLDVQCSLQLGTWGIFMSFTGLRLVGAPPPCWVSTVFRLRGLNAGQEVELLKLHDVDMPIIEIATQVSVGLVKLKGRNLDGCKIIASTPGGSANLPYVSQCERERGGLELLIVQLPFSTKDRGLHIYAVKSVNIEGFPVSVRSECAYIKVDEISQCASPGDPSAVILTTLILAVPVGHFSWPMVVPSANSTALAVACQFLGWMLGLGLLRLWTVWSSERGLSAGIPLLARWRCSIALVMVTTFCILSWKRFAVLDTQKVLVSTVTATVLGVAVCGRFKLLKCCEVEVATRLAYWEKIMTTSKTYGEWAQAANMLEIEGAILEPSKLYDEDFVRIRLGELQARRIEGNSNDILYSLQDGLFRNLGDMSNEELHRGRQKTPPLICAYLNEVRSHLHAIFGMDSQQFSLEQKLAYMMEARKKLGRTALIFVGHSELGTFHYNVLQTLVEHQLLPSIVVGADVGAIIAAYSTTRTEIEFGNISEDDMAVVLPRIIAASAASLRLRRHDAGVYEVEKLQECVQDLIGDLTFKEAFVLSGRVLGISTPSNSHFFNHITCPHVVIWSAVAVSCVPSSGRLKCELMAKNQAGSIVQYVNPTTAHSKQHAGPTVLETEIPYNQLQRLFDVNNVILSQASLYVAPLLHFKEKMTHLGGMCACKVVELVGLEVKHRCAMLSKIGVDIGGLTSLFSHDWEGDINIVMPLHLPQALGKLIKSPGDEVLPDELQKSAMEGRRCTWAKLSGLQASCGVEYMLDAYILELTQGIMSTRGFEDVGNVNTNHDESSTPDIELEQIIAGPTGRSFHGNHDADEIFQATRLSKTSSGGFKWGDSDLEFDIEDMDTDELYDLDEQESSSEVEEVGGDNQELDAGESLVLCTSGCESLEGVDRGPQVLCVEDMVEEGRPGIHDYLECNPLQEQVSVLGLRDSFEQGLEKIKLEEPTEPREGVLGSTLHSPKNVLPITRSGCVEPKKERENEQEKVENLENVKLVGGNAVDVINKNSLPRIYSNSIEQELRHDSIKNTDVSQCVCKEQPGREDLHTHRNESLPEVWMVSADSGQKQETVGNIHHSSPRFEVDVFGNDRQELFAEPRSPRKVLDIVPDCSTSPEAVIEKADQVDDIEKVDNLF